MGKLGRRKKVPQGRYMNGEEKEKWMDNGSDLTIADGFSLFLLNQFR